jgi:Na+/proline symporter
MRMEVGGLLGLIVLIADIWAIVHVLGSSSSTGAKVLWTVLILIFPVLGFLIWLLFGPRAVKSPREPPPLSNRHR